MNGKTLFNQSLVVLIGAFLCGLNALNQVSSALYLSQEEKPILLCGAVFYVGVFYESSFSFLI